MLRATFLFQPHYGNDAYQFASTKTGRSSPGFYNNKQPIEWTNIIPTIDNPQPSSQYRYVFFLRITGTSTFHVEKVESRKDLGK